MSVSVFRFFIILCVIFSVSIPAAHAKRRSSVLKWIEQDFYRPDDMARPYTENGTAPHSYLWQKDADPAWSPEDWIITRGSIEAVLEDLYIGGVITDQSENDDIPVLEVGNTFLALSHKMQGRILRFLDYAYGITENDAHGMIHIEHDETNRRIGLYTAYGLQMQ